MFWSLNGPAIGVNVPLPDLIVLARRHGFLGVDFSIEEAAELVKTNGIANVRRIFDDNATTPTVWGLPVQVLGDPNTFAADLEKLARYAKLSAALGCTRTVFPMRPYSDERAFDENFRLHVDRFRQIARILEADQVRLGIEFIGPKTLRDEHRVPFIYSVGGLKELLRAIGMANVGVLLDSYHWYTSHGTSNDIRALRNSEIVHVHVNDAVPGRAVDEQIDLDRLLPGKSGLIDLVTFLGELSRIGYNGGITVEPFDASMANLPAEAAVAVTAESLRRVWDRAGIVNQP